MTDIFSSKRDAEVIATGGFYCYACVVGKPINEQSPDPRYCAGCKELLLSDARIDEEQPMRIVKVPRKPGTVSSVMVRKAVAKKPPARVKTTKTGQRVMF